MNHSSRPKRRTPSAMKTHRPSQSLRPGLPNVGAPTYGNSELLKELAAWIAVSAPSSEQIKKYQSEIHEQTLTLSRAIDRPNFRKVGREDLFRMIQLYDQRFFGGRVLPIAMDDGLTFSFSSRMTRVAGKLVTHYESGRKEGQRKFELVLSSTLLFQTFEDVERSVKVTGICCNNRLEAMQRIAEHEFTHLIEMMIWNVGNCNQSRFQWIANRYFGHKDYRHELITQRERAWQRFNIKVGDFVRFGLNGHVMVGRVNRITRRATVLVESSQGERFSDGKRYARYYVPLEKLTAIQ